jgi:ABC-type Fe3+-hydroxamate transport system substrate-binding protein
VTRETPNRVVSLVPSLTESVVFLGAGQRLVGRTRYCVEPAGALAHVPTLGGTKDPAVDNIVALRPDLVLVSAEENRIEDVERLSSAGLRIENYHPRSVEDAAVAMLRLGESLGEAEPAMELAESCRRAAALVRDGLERSRVRTFCPVWRRPWMTFGKAVYVADLLRTVGCENIFDDGESDWFEVSLEEVVERRPALILLPDEPYAFSPAHADELRRAGLELPIVFIDGKDLSWYGPRLPGALPRLAGLVAGAV